MSTNATITPQATLVLDSPEAHLIHGSAFVDPYVIGTPRAGPPGGQFDDHARIVRIEKGDYSTYDSVRLVDPNDSNVFLSKMDDAVVAGGKVYTVAQSGTNDWIVEIDPTSDFFTATPVAETFGNNGVEALATDGTYLYGAGSFWLRKWSLVDFSQVDATNYDLGGSIHSMVLGDDGMLYAIGSTNPGTDPVLLGQFDPTDLSLQWTVQVPKSTDDMAQVGDWVMGGVEETDDTKFGFGWGAFAVRISDQQLFSLPAFPSQRVDVGGVTDITYASWIRGNKFFDLKTAEINGGRLYVIDFASHPPDTWSQQSDTSQVVEIVGEYDLPGSFVPPDASIYHNNELLLDPEGNLHAFFWPSSSTLASWIDPSGAARFTVPGLSLVPEPGTVSGIVRREGSPVGGARVQFLDPSGVALSATSDANGDYTLTGLDAGKTYHLFVEHTDGSGTVFHGVSQPGVTGVTEVSGRVLHKGDVPVQGAAVYAVEATTGEEALGTGLATTDEDGKYEVKLLPSDTPLHVVAEASIGGEPHAALSEAGVVAP